MIYRKNDIEGDWLKKTEQLTDSMFYIMAALTKPRHGYAIMNLIEEKTKGATTSRSCFNVHDY